MFTQSRIDHLTDLSESILYLTTNLEKMLNDALPYCKNMHGHTKEEILGQVLALKVIANDLDMGILPED